MKTNHPLYIAVDAKSIRRIKDAKGDLKAGFASLHTSPPSENIADIRAWARLRLQMKNKQITIFASTGETIIEGQPRHPSP